MFWVRLEILMVFIPCLINIFVFVLSLISQWRFISSVLLFNNHFDQLIIKLFAFLFLSGNCWLRTSILFGLTSFDLLSLRERSFNFVRVWKPYMFIWVIFVLFERFGTILLCSLLTAWFWTVFNDSRRSCTERVSRLIVLPLIISTDLLRLCPHTGL